MLATIQKQSSLLLLLQFLFCIVNGCNQSLAPNAATGNCGSSLVTTASQLTSTTFCLKIFFLTDYVLYFAFSFRPLFIVIVFFIGNGLLPLNNSFFRFRKDVDLLHSTFGACSMPMQNIGWALYNIAFFYGLPWLAFYLMVTCSCCYNQAWISFSFVIFFVVLLQLTVSSDKKASAAINDTFILLCFSSFSIVIEFDNIPQRYFDYYPCW